MGNEFSKLWLLSDWIGVKEGLVFWLFQGGNKGFLDGQN